MKIGNLARSIRTKGLQQSLRLARRRLVSPRFFDYGAVLIMENTMTPAKAALPVEPDARWATPDDAEAIGALRLGAEEVRRRFASGAACTVLEFEGRIVASSWVRAAPADALPWLHLKLPSSDLWGYDLEMDPAHRGRGLATSLRRFRAREFSRAAYRRCLSAVDRSNRSSLRSAAKVDRITIAAIRHLRLGPVNLVVAGGRLRVGRWTRAHPLELPIEEIEG